MFSEWQWQVLTLPPRHFSWRVRGNPLYWALQERTTLAQDYDLLVATSMVDLATLRGLVPSLAAIPSILYFHENQFSYPRDRLRHSLLEAQMVSLYGALAADRVAFNSAFNRDSFLAGCDDLLDRLPDRVPAGVTALLAGKSRVVPVPVQVPAHTGKRSSSDWPGLVRDAPGRPLRLLWVGRFEHDKGGDRLLAVLRLLARGGLSFELAVVGQQFRNSPLVFEQIAAEFRHCLVHYGFLQSPTEYHAVLRAADLVLSTTLHEFQGIAVMEAVANGCLPVVPDRLAYPEIYPMQHRYQSDLIDPASEATSAASLVGELWERSLAGQVSSPDVSAFTIDALRSAYSELFGVSGVPSG